MKSYACLLVACSPLLYFVATETKSLGVDTLETIQITKEASGGKDQLAKAKAEVVKFEQIEKAVPGLPAGTLGIAPLPPNLEASGAGLQRTLSEKFADYAKAAEAVRKFVIAFEEKKSLEPEDLGEGKYGEAMKKLLAERKRIADDEKNVQTILTALQVSAEQEKKVLEYAASPVSDTGLVDRFASKLRKGHWTDADSVRGGSVLVLVIATADLRAEETLTGEMLDQVLQAIRSQPEERDR